MFASLFLVILGSCYCSTEIILGRPWLFGPSEALEKSIITLQCELLDYPKNESILLQLFKEGNRDKLLSEFTSMNGVVAVFNMVIKLDHEGNLECVAKAQNNSNIRPTVSSTHYLRVVQPVKAAELVHSGPAEFFEGKTLELHCKVIGNHVSYKWLLNGRLVSQPISHHDGDNLLIYRTTSKDSGSYMCVTTNSFNKTVYISNSSEVVITVKDLVSDPDISFTVLKEDINVYSVAVTCESIRGTPPITFSLTPFNRTELVTERTVEERSTTFKVPLVFDRHLGWFQCMANNSDQVTNSKWIPIEVERVGGPMVMNYDYDIGENYAVIGLRFYCMAAKGSFPRYQWFLNTTLLHDRGSFYRVVHQPPEKSILLLAVGKSSTGTYHCQVSDSFDNTTVISSKRWYLDREVLNRVHILVVAVVFGCFTILLLLVSVCCCIGVLFRRREYGEKSLLSLEMKSMVAAYEGELDESEYCEEAEVLETARPGEFDQASEASADEWAQIENKRLEDETLEQP